MNQVVYTSRARQDLKELQSHIAHRIIKKIYFFNQQKNPFVFAKRLTSSQLGQYRFRIGDYRVLFDVNHKGHIHILLILRITHRKDVYDL